MTEDEARILAAFSLGDRAWDALGGSSLRAVARRGETFLERGPRGTEDETALFASVLADVRDAGTPELLAEVVPLLRNRFAFPPLVGLAVPPDLEGAWSLERLLALSRELRVPVVRAGSGSSVSLPDLARLFSEPLGVHGLTCIDAADVETIFAPPSAGLVFKWMPWRGELPVALPAPLAQAVRAPGVTAAFLCYRTSPAGTLHRIDEAVRRVQAALPSATDLLLATPVGEWRRDELIVTVVHADPSSARW